ncbi:MAG: hypothetical protein JW809_17730 [Pirellulales bacterium]|nr:hypothetical protein [Pirellulales bacterium]
MRRAAIGLAILLAAHAPAACAVEPAPPEITGIRVGLGGWYKLGCWTPVVVTLRGGDWSQSGEIVLTVPDGDGVPAEIPSDPRSPCRVEPDGETTVAMFARFGRVEPECRVRFVVDGRVAAERTFQASAGGAEPDGFPPALGAARKLIVEVGAVGAGVAEAVDLVPELPGNEPVLARLDNVNAMPTRWYGYEGVAALVLSTSRPETFGPTAAETETRLAALDRWVRMGGTLVLLVGSRGQEVLDPAHPLARFAPGKFNRMERLRWTTAMETHLGGANPVQAEDVSLRVPRLDMTEGTVEVAQADLPLVVRATRGFGQVVFVATDLDQAPWDGWKDRGAAMAKLLGLPIAPGDVERSLGATIMREGYDDMTGQLRSCLDRFTGVRPVGFGVVVAGILLYVLLIGPGDYFLLRRLGRFEWTWVTFPLVVVAACAAAYGLAAWLKGDALRVNQVDLVDVDVSSGFVRGTTWANLFSPRTDTYNLALRPHLPPGDCPGFRASDNGTVPLSMPGAEVLFSWLGLPGRGLGGMQANTTGLAPSRRTYAFAPALDSFSGMPVQVSSTKSLTARWIASWRGAIEADLAEVDELPSGTLSHSLAFPLENCLFAYDRWVYDLGTLAPGKTLRIEAVGQRAKLGTLLTGRRLVRDERGDRLREESTPYNVSSDDAAYVLRQMMFFDATGGARYTSLSNEYQPFVDASHLLGTTRGNLVFGPGRAILVGFAPRDQKPVAALVRDGRPLVEPENRRLVAFRFVLPVKRNDSNRPDAANR